MSETETITTLSEWLICPECRSEDIKVDWQLRYGFKIKCESCGKEYIRQP